MVIKIGIVGYGTIGKRVADAILLQKDMKLVGITAHNYNWKVKIANERKLKIFSADGKELFEPYGIKIEGDIKDLINESDIIVDCTPKKVGKENKEKYYLTNKVKALFQGGEKPDVAEVSFVAQCNYKEALNKDYVRIVSCNTTGLCRTLNAIDKEYGIEEVHATMIRRGADPWDIRHGPINAIVPVLELPSHHGPDVRTVLPNIEIFTTALSVSSTLMHMHNLIVDCKKTPTVDGVLDLFNKTTRIRLVDNVSMIRSTAEIMEYAKDLGRNTRGDIPEICIWREGVGAYQKKLFYMQAIHQESDVIPENIDAIRAMTGFEDAEKSIKLTNKTLNIK